MRCRGLRTDTWEDLNTLRNFRGYKRVENYIKTVYTQEQRYVKDRQHFSGEDIEAFEIDRERKREQIEGFKTVERIIASRNASANIDVQYDHRESYQLEKCIPPSVDTCTSAVVEYLCKWKGLVYAEATWEDHDTIAAIAQNEIDAFVARSSAPTLPHRSAPYTRNRPPFKAMTTQPDYIAVGGELKDFQITGLNWLVYLWCRHENGILADEVRAPYSNKITGQALIFTFLRWLLSDGSRQE